MARLTGEREHAPRDAVAELRCDRSRARVGHAPPHVEKAYADVLDTFNTLMPEMKAKWRTASGKSGTLSGTPISLAAGEAGEWFELGGWRITVPPQASLAWPVLPHNPYTKDGHAEAKEGRIVMTLPFDSDVKQYSVEVICP